MADSPKPRAASIIGATKTKSPTVKPNASPVLAKATTEAPKIGALPAADYFAPKHTRHDSLTTEPNPFEQSFSGNNGASLTNGHSTPGGSRLLPGINAITSPAGLLPGGVYNSSFQSLRHGPLSPAMLTGPTNNSAYPNSPGGYFAGAEHNFIPRSGTGVTPNESSMRTGFTPGGHSGLTPSFGLTPGGGGSMFQDTFTGVMPTPATVDFHRSAMQANLMRGTHAAPSQPQNVTSQPQAAVGSAAEQSLFGEHEADEAANGLFLLANPPRNQGEDYVVTHNPLNTAMMGITPSQIGATPMMAGHQMNGAHMRAGLPNGQNGVKHNRSASASHGGSSDEDEPQTTKSSTRGKGKRGSIAQPNTANGRNRLKEEPSSKPPPAKRGKANNGNAHASPPEDSGEEQEEIDMNKEEFNANGKKMTDDEKRKNFLERNRVAALKCRQRKKQWLANLQSKVEAYATENEHLHQVIAEMQDQNGYLKGLLDPHRECPIGRQQNLAQMLMAPVEADQQQAPNQLQNSNQNQNPYGLAQPTNMMQSTSQQQHGNGQSMDRHQPY